MKSLAESLGLNTPETPETPSKKQSAKEFSKSILESRDYRKSVERRIATDTLPPAVEVRFMEYAYGKPVEKVEIRDKTNPLEQMSLEELQAKAAGLAALAAKLRAAQNETKTVH